ncbi:MAG: PaaI family thioesterase [Acidobacteria bacterium]|nr:PaaI family thioesterase [Acidobacteriota bacterium]
MPKLYDLFRERVAAGAPMGLYDTLGIKLEHLAPGEVTVSMEVHEGLHNFQGTMHGGVYCDVADLAMGVAFFCSLEEGEAMTTLELKINYLRPVSEGRIAASAKVVNKGQTTGLVECDIRDEQGRLLARSSSTCYIFRGAKAEASIQKMSGWIK